MQHFGFESHDFENANEEHECCDNCEKLCKCEACSISSSSQQHTAQESLTDAEAAERNMVEQAISTLFDMLSCSNDDIINSAFTAGLSSSLAHEIACKHSTYYDEASLAADHSYLNDDIVNYIYQVIEQVRERN